MRKILMLFCFLITTISFSQNKQILYNFTTIPQSLMTNPGADVNYKWYAGVPILSGISINMGSTGFSAYDLFAKEGVDFNLKLQKLLSSTSAKDWLAINQQLELFNGGFRIGTDENKAYLSFGLYQELDFFGYVPHDVAVLAINGNKDYLGKHFNLGDIKAKAELLSVFHIGYHKKIQDNLVLGLRAKIYSSIFNASSINNSGYIYTAPSTDAFYTQTIYSDLQLNTSGAGAFASGNYNGNAATDLKKGILMGGNLGLGVDFGVTFYPQPNLQITASLLDLGFVNHTKNINNFTYKGIYNYKGLVPNFNNENTAEANYKEFNKAIVLDTLPSQYTTWRPTKFNISIQYSFEEYKEDEACNCEAGNNGVFYKSGIGTQLFFMTAPKFPLFAWTTFYKRNFSKALQMKATYTVDSYSFTNVGLGFSTQLGAVNFYALADNLLAYTDVSKAKSLSFQLGLNLVFKE